MATECQARRTQDLARGSSQVWPTQTPSTKGPSRETVSGVVVKW